MQTKEKLKEILEAVQNCPEEQLKFLRDKFDLASEYEASNFNEKLLILSYAAAKEELRVVEKLINAGARMEYDDNARKWSPIHYAVMAARFRHIGLLLKHKAAVDARGEEGFTPLRLAISAARRTDVFYSHYYQHVAMTLIEAKAALDFCDPNCEDNIIHLAAESGNASVMHHLLQQGYLPDTPRKDGATPLEIAILPTAFVVKWNNRCDWELQHHEVVKTLLMAKASPNRRPYWDPDKDSIPSGHNYEGNPGGTLLHWAVRNDWSRIASMLLAAKADVHAKNDKGLTPYSLIKYDNRPCSLRERLLDGGADPFQPVPSLRVEKPILLHLVPNEPAWRDSGPERSFVAKLTRLGADPNESHENIIPLLAALEGDHLEIARALIEARADLTHPKVCRWKHFSSTLVPLHCHFKIYLMANGAPAPKVPKESEDILKDSYYDVLRPHARQLHSMAVVRECMQSRRSEAYIPKEIYASGFYNPFITSIAADLKDYFSLWQEIYMALELHGGDAKCLLKSHDKPLIKHEDHNLVEAIDIISRDQKDSRAEALMRIASEFAECLSPEFLYKRDPVLFWASCVELALFEDKTGKPIFSNLLPKDICGLIINYYMGIPGSTSKTNIYASQVLDKELTQKHEESSQNEYKKIAEQQATVAKNDPKVDLKCKAVLKGKVDLKDKVDSKDVDEMIGSIGLNGNFFETELLCQRLLKFKEDYVCTVGAPKLKPVPDLGDGCGELYLLFGSKHYIAEASPLVHCFRNTIS